MSEQTNDSVNQADDSSASTDSTNQTLTNSDSDYKRDMFRYKDEARALRDQLRDIELDKKQKSGDLEGAISSLKDEIKQLKHKNASDSLSYAETQMNSSIKEELLARGVKGKKLDAFLKLVDDNDKSIVELDEKFNVNVDDVKSLVDKNMERYGDLFKTEVKIVDGSPRSDNNFKAKDVDFNKMSSAQMKEYILANKDKLN